MITIAELCMFGCAVLVGLFIFLYSLMAHHAYTYKDDEGLFIALFMLAFLILFESFIMAQLIWNII